MLTSEEGFVQADLSVLDSFSLNTQVLTTEWIRLGPLAVPTLALRSQNMEKFASEMALSLSSKAI